MNVVVNGRFLERRITGVERYGREILSRLGNGLILPSRSPYPRPEEVRGGRADGIAGLTVVRCEGRAAGARGHLWEQFELAGKVNHEQLLWSPANTGPLNVRNQVLTLHDISPLEHPEWFQPAFALWYLLILPLLVRRVRLILTPSNYVRRKVLRRFNLPDERVTVLPGGVDTGVFHPSASSQLKLPSRYALFVGSLQPRKNIARLLKAWGQVKDALPGAWLLIAGSGGGVFRPIALETPERVKFLGEVPDAQLPGLYAGATVFILPSFDEGFGLPVLEAMASGTLVIASNVGALPEVIGDSGLFFDPQDVSGMANALQCGFQDAALRDSLREKGLARARQFSWDVSSKMLWRIFEQCH